MTSGSSTGGTSDSGVDAMSPLAASCKLINAFQGGDLYKASWSTIHGESSLDVVLRWGPTKPDFALSFEGVHFLRIDRFSQGELPFVDRIAAEPVVPGSGSRPRGWPSEALPMDLSCPLIWVRTMPFALEVIATAVTVLREDLPGTEND